MKTKAWTRGHYTAVLTCPTGSKGRETTIVEATNKTDAGFKAIRKLKRAIGAKAAKDYTLWSITYIHTTF